MSIPVLSSIIGVVDDIIGMANTFKQAEERKRERVAAWLQELGELIQDVADKIELNDYPHNTCAQMEIMIEHFPKVVDDCLSKHMIEKISMQLRACCNIEQLFGEINSLEKPARDDNIIILLVASGKLKGLSSIVKYSE